MGQIVKVWDILLRSEPKNYQNKPFQILLESNVTAKIIGFVSLIVLQK
jgi:hypothetical protein